MYNRGYLFTTYNKQLKEAENPVQSINAYSIKPPIQILMALWETMCTFGYYKVYV